jgi:hypothetical protein
VYKLETALLVIFQVLVMKALELMTGLLNPDQRLIVLFNDIFRSGLGWLGNVSLKF